MINNAENLYQITGRGQFGDVSAKIAYDIVKFEDEFKDLAFIIGRSGMKSDTDIARGVFEITLSGFGSPKEAVYADPVTLAFHPEAFATEADVGNYQRYTAEIMQELQDAIDNNYLPDKVLKNLSKVLDEDVSMLPISSQLSRIRYQELARKTIELHQSGIGPKNSALMMNMLHKHYLSEGAKVINKGDRQIFMPVMPDVNRFAISTESADILAGGRPILGEYVTKSGKAGMADITFDLGAKTGVTAELMKFRVSRNRILLHSGDVARYFNALGGFDLDDKGLPKLMTASRKDSKTGKTIRDLMFTMTRQPSGTEEVIYSSATLDDIETLRHFFAKDDFISYLNNIRGKDPVMNRLYEILSSNKANISGPMKIPGRVLSEEEIKEAILQVYDVMHADGKATITAASDEVLQNIATYGSSPLRANAVYRKFGVQTLSKVSIDDALQQSFMEADEAQQVYIREGLQRVLSEDIYQQTIDQKTYNDVMQAATSGDIRKLISTFDATTMPVELRGALNKTIIELMAKVSTEEKDILGVYVNRSMVIGSTFHQTEQFIQGLSDDELRQLSKYKIAMGTQEFAIDRAVNFTAQRQFLAQVAEYSVGVSGTGAGAILVSKLLGKDKMDLDNVMQEALLNLGRRMGAETAIFYGKGMTDMSMKPVIDKLLLETRLTSESDIPKIIQGMIEGLTSTKEELGYNKQEIEDLISALQRATVSSERGRQYLLENFSASADHRFATVTKMAEQAAKFHAESAMMVRLGLSNILEDQILASTTVSKEASNIADFLLDRHVKNINSLFGDKAKELSDSEIIRFEKRRLLQTAAISNELEDSARMSGLSQEEIINALEKRAYQRGIDFRNFEKLDIPIDDRGTSFATKLKTTRARRIRSYYQNVIDSEEMTRIEQVAKFVGGSPEGVDPYFFADPINQQMVESFRQGEVNERNVAIRNIVFQNELNQDIVDNISARGTVQAAVSQDKTFTEGVQTAMAGGDYSTYLTDRTPYKRFMQYMKDGELKNLFTENATFRRSVYAAGALIAGSFIYSAVKDHTPEKIQGPPLLPGGSAYEQQYPNRIAEIPQIGTVNYNPGVSYKVNLYGGKRDVENFRSMAMELGNFDMNTTMYSGIPDVGRDPYAEIASSY